MQTSLPTLPSLPAPTDDLDRAEQDLRDHAICAVTGVLDADTLRSLHDDLYDAANDDRSNGSERAGFVLDPDATNQRVWNLLNRSPAFVDLAEHPVALRLLRSVLGWPMLLGNISGNITGPGGGAGVLHADQLFVPQPWPAAPQGANAAWCIDDFTADVGATCFVPASHLRNQPPQAGESASAIPYEAPAGSLIVFDSRVWHQTGANVTTGRSRGAVFGWYTRPIYRTQENWFLSLGPTVKETASEQMLELLGYKTQGLGLVNGSSPV